MSFFRRSEPIHVRLARAGGLLGSGGRPFPFTEVGIHGLHRAREWDAVVTAETSRVRSDEAEFVTLPDGELVVESGDGDMSPLADAVEEALAPPYRAIAVRQGQTQWAVAARSSLMAPLSPAARRGA